MHDSRSATPRFSAKLERVLAGQARERRHRLTRRRRRQRIVALATVATIAVFGFTLDLLPPGASSPPVAKAVVLPDGTTVSFDEFTRPRNRARLIELFRRHGAVLQIRYKPVNPRAAGRFLGLQTPDGAGAGPRGIHVTRDASGPYIVTIGRARSENDPGPNAHDDAAGLLIYESIPELCEAVDLTDAPATARELKRRGFDVKVMAIAFGPDTNPDPQASNAGGIATAIDAPPAGTVVVSVLSRSGAAMGVPADTRSLLLEVAKKGNADGHEPTAPKPAVCERSR